VIKKESLEADLKSAIRGGDEVRKRTLRMLLSALKLMEVEKRQPLGETELLTALQREVKSRREAIADAERAGRSDLVASSQAELDVLQAYMPAALSSDDLQRLARAAIEEASAAGPQDMGKVMKVLMPQVQGRADGKHVNDLVRTLLAQPRS
jgi:uncharacterized protein YqeY